MPVYNDWDALRLLLPALANELSANGLRAAVLLVDDGSTVLSPKNLGDENYSSIESIDILHLRRNVGHQRAIAIGLCYIAANCPCQHVVIMDSDGEDDPRDVPRLIRESLAHKEQKIIIARLLRPSDDMYFSVF